MSDYLGLYKGVVVNNADPERRGRVMLKVPQVLGDAVTGWCDPVLPTRHTFPVGEPVYVQFLNGDPAKPVFSSTFTVTADKIDSEAITARTIATGAINSGHVEEGFLYAGAIDANQITSGSILAADIGITGSITASGTTGRQAILDSDGISFLDENGEEVITLTTDPDDDTPSRLSGEATLDAARISDNFSLNGRNNEFARRSHTHLRGQVVSSSTKPRAKRYWPHFNLWLDSGVIDKLFGMGWDPDPQDAPPEDPDLIPDPDPTVPSVCREVHPVEEELLPGMDEPDDSGLNDGAVETDPIFNDGRTTFQVESIYHYSYIELSFALPDNTTYVVADPNTNSPTPRPVVTLGYFDYDTVFPVLKYGGQTYTYPNSTHFRRDEISGIDSVGSWVGFRYFIEDGIDTNFTDVICVVKYYLQESIDDETPPDDGSPGDDPDTTTDTTDTGKYFVGTRVGNLLNFVFFEEDGTPGNVVSVSGQPHGYVSFKAFGVTFVGGYYYAVGEATSTTGTTNLQIRRYTLANGVMTGDQYTVLPKRAKNAWDTYGKFGALGSTGTAPIYAFGDGPDRVRTYTYTNTDLGSGYVNIPYDTSSFTNGNTPAVAFIGRKQYDFSGERTLIGLRGGHTIYAYNGLLRRSVNDFPLPRSAAGLRGMVYRPTTHTSFRSIDANRVIHTYSKIKWTSQSSKWWVGFSWFAHGTRYETTLSKVRSFTMYKRCFLRLIAPPVTDTDETDDPDSVRFYLGRGATKPTRLEFWRNATSAVGTSKAEIWNPEFANRKHPRINNTFPNTQRLGARFYDGAGNILFDGDNFSMFAPPGTILELVSSDDQPGWLKCNGAAYSKTEYWRLFGVIGAQFNLSSDPPNSTWDQFRVPNRSPSFTDMSSHWFIKY